MLDRLEYSDDTRPPVLRTPCKCSEPEVAFHGYQEPQHTKSFPVLVQWFSIPKQFHALLLQSLVVEGIPKPAPGRNTCCYNATCPKPPKKIR